VIFRTRRLRKYHEVWMAPAARYISPSLRRCSSLQTTTKSQFCSFAAAGARIRRPENFREHLIGNGIRLDARRSKASPPPKNEFSKAFSNRQFAVAYLTASLGRAVKLQRVSGRHSDERGTGLRQVAKPQWFSGC